ncbi:MAG TPA: polysaccharide biosynthesis/export family protein [Flavisolibacter sp.]|nr:polysaccharide biosynthesis/export family protein [Flavisolibacter sp.]
MHVLILLKKKWSLVIGCFLCVLFCSCVNTREATYFNDLKDSTQFRSGTLPETFIKSSDILDITVSSLNPEATAIFNPSHKANGENTGYLVEPNGTILFPVLGSIKVEGLTKEQLKAQLTKMLADKKLLVDPIVSVRFQNFRVTVLGEVKNPAVIPVPSEKISMLEAIGLAGDLTIYARRDNVLLIREENGVKMLKRINLNTNELLGSSYYYLKANDVIYVEPNKSKVASTSRTQAWLPAAFSGLSFVAIVLDRILK